MHALIAWWRRVRDGGALTRLLETFALADGELVLVETPPDRTA
jgi:hypothetical protein